MTDLINITTAADINASFLAISECGSGYSNEEIRTFGEMFWAELTEANRKLYRHVCPRTPLNYENAAEAMKQPGYDAPLSSADNVDNI